MGQLTVQGVYDWLNALAPFETAESFDNVGLLLGDPGAPVSKVLFGLDATPALAREAEALGAELVVTHHPLIFTPLRRIDYTSPQGQALTALVRGGVSLLAAHTNWDKAPGGVSDALAAALGLQSAAPGDAYLRIGRLPAPMTAEALERRIEARLRVKPAVYGAGDGLLSTVAVAGGAYGEAAVAARTLGAQAYVVGEIKHHELLDACERGLVVYEAGHYATEVPGIEALYRRFLTDAAAAGWRTEAHLFHHVPYAGAQL